MDMEAQKTNKEKADLIKHSIFAGWKEISLGEIVTTLETGTRPKGGAVGVLDGIPSLSAEHMTNYGKFDFSELRYVPEEFYEQMTRGHIQRNDVLIVKDGATTGKTVFIDEHFPFDKAVINEHVFICRFDLEVADPKYIFYFLWSNEGQKQIKQSFQGAAIGGINQSFVNKVILPLPPLDEQKRIAKRLNEELSAVEAARKAAEEQLQAAWELPSAYLREVFASKESQGWQTIKLGEILSSTKNGLYKPDKFYGQGKRILKMYNIGRLDGTWNLERVDLIDLTDSEYEDYRLNMGDILINRVNSRELVGKCAVIDESVDGAVYESKNIRIRLDTERAEPDFVAAYINSKNGRDQFESRLKQIVGQATINRSDLESFEIPLPPLKVQKQLIEELKIKQENARNLVASIESQLAEINALPSALLGRAFRGELL